MHERSSDKHEGERRPIYVASTRRDGRLRRNWKDVAEVVAHGEAGISLDHRRAGKQSRPVGTDEVHPAYIMVGSRRGLSTIAETAAGIIDHGQAFRAWADLVGDDLEALEQFEAAFLGSWDNVAQFAEQLIAESDDSHATDREDEDAQSRNRRLADELADELQRSGAIHVVPCRGGGVWLFRPPIRRGAAEDADVAEGGGHE